jgi:hypothetical protein
MCRCLVAAAWCNRRGEQLTNQPYQTLTPQRANCSCYKTVGLGLRRNYRNDLYRWLKRVGLQRFGGRWKASGLLRIQASVSLWPELELLRYITCRVFNVWENRSFVNI